MRSGDAPFVPSLAVQSTFVLVLASFAMFVAYVHHIARSIHIESIIRRVWEETRAAIDQCHPDQRDEATELPAALPPGEGMVVARVGRPGVVAGLDLDGLRARAEADDCTVTVVPAIGDFVPEGAPLVTVRGDRVSTSPPGRFSHLVRIENERTMRQDPAFGFRQLVDIALGALSPGINDPTTAAHAVERLHDLLRRLATRPIPPGVSGRRVRNGAGRDQRGHVGRLRRAGGRRDPSRRRRPAPRSSDARRRMLDESVRRADERPADGDLARHPDHQGVGDGGGVPGRDPADGAPA